MDKEIGRDTRPLFNFVAKVAILRKIFFGES
jgi:hypothetical protein